MLAFSNLQILYCPVLQQIHYPEGVWNNWYYIGLHKAQIKVTTDIQGTYCERDKTAMPSSYTKWCRISVTHVCTQLVWSPPDSFHSAASLSVVNIWQKHQGNIDLVTCWYQSYSNPGGDLDHYCLTGGKRHCSGFDFQVFLTCLIFGSVCFKCPLGFIEPLQGKKN